MSLNRKFTYTLLVCTLCIFMPTLCLESQVLGSAGLEFQTVQKGYYSRHKKPAYYVIQDENGWIDLWNQHCVYMPRPPPPKVNFIDTTIIAVFMGQFSTGGYDILIKEIVNKGQSILVRVEKTYPDKGSTVTEAFTQPHHIVKVDKIDREIEFETVEMIRK